MDEDQPTTSAADVAPDGTINPENVPAEAPAAPVTSASRTNLSTDPSADTTTTDRPASPPPQPQATDEKHPFLDRKDVYIKPETRLPEDSELALAKAFLMTQSEKTNMNLYDHLTEVVMRILETRPGNSVDAFETISADIKRSHFRVDRPHAPGAFQKVQDLAPASEMGKAQVKLFDRSNAEEASSDDADADLPDIMDLANLWEWAGVSFGKEETFMLFLSLRRLVAEKPLRSVRLWGKIFGTQANYIIIEGELKEGADDEDGDAVNATEEPNEEAAEGGEGGEKANEEAEPALPKPKVKKMGPLPKEERTGVNKYVYYVCIYAGGPWTRLPDVIPEKLQAARRVRKYFTGNLGHKIVSYPPFDGTEAQYLRCQIARISAATVVSPAGYYAFDQDEDNDDEDNAQSQNIIINPDYEGLPNDQLADPTNWVHHVPYILPQGRVTWVNSSAGQRTDQRDEDEEGSDAGSDEGEDREEEEEVEPETGPTLLTALSDDAEHGDIPAWTARMCSVLSPAKFSPVLLRCMRWPGATVVAYNDKFANIYVGDGHKDQGRFIPPPLPEVQKEYATGDGAAGAAEDITEHNDPTLEEEMAFEEEKRAREEEQEEESDEEEEEGGDEEGDED